jgi:hypothetical protein
MSDTPPKVTLTFTAEFVFNKYVRPADLPDYCVNGRSLSEVIDLRPYATDALAEYTGETDLDVDMLSRLAARLWNGAYIRSADYPAGVDKKLVKRLAMRMEKRVWVTRGRQEEPSRRFPFRQISCDDWACAKALALRGQRFHPADVPLLPFPDCWEQCRCWYDFATPTDAS